MLVLLQTFWTVSIILILLQFIFIFNSVYFLAVIFTDHVGDVWSYVLPTLCLKLDTFQLVWQVLLVFSGTKIGIHAYAVFIMKIKVL